MELKAYIKRYLPTLYLQHRWKMNEPVDEDERVARVRDGITEDTGVELDLAEVERLIQAHVPGAWRSLTPAEALLDALLNRPVVSVSEVAQIVDRTFANANQLVARFEELGILRETTGQQRNRRYRYEDLYRLLRR